MSMTQRLTCLGVEYQNVGSCPEQLLEVFVVADLLYERRNLHCVQHRQQPHLVEHSNTNSTAESVTMWTNNNTDEPSLNTGLHVFTFVHFHHSSTII